MMLSSAIAATFTILLVAALIGWLSLWSSSDIRMHLELRNDRVRVWAGPIPIPWLRANVALDSETQILVRGRVHIRGGVDRASYRLVALGSDGVDISLARFPRQEDAELALFVQQCVQDSLGLGATHRSNKAPKRVRAGRKKQPRDRARASRELPENTGAELLDDESDARGKRSATSDT